MAGQRCGWGVGAVVVTVSVRVAVDTNGLLNAGPQGAAKRHRFTRKPPRRENRCRLLEAETQGMPLSGEAIRMMNYVDDISTTMRRLLAVAPTLTPEERKRVSEYLRKSTPNATEVLTILDAK